MKIEPFKMEVTPEQSKQVQEIVFNNGGKWMSRDRHVKCTEHPFLMYDHLCSLQFGEENARNDEYMERPEPQITFSEFMSRYGGAEATQFDTMRKIVTIAEDAHKNGDAELCSVLLISLADYISNNRPE